MLVHKGRLLLRVSFRDPEQTGPRWNRVSWDHRESSLVECSCDITHDCSARLPLPSLYGTSLTILITKASIRV